MTYLRSFTVIGSPIANIRPKTSTIYRNVGSVLQGLLNNVLYFGHLRGFEAFNLPIGRIAVSHIPFNPGSTQLVCFPPIRPGAVPDHLHGGA